MGESDADLALTVDAKYSRQRIHQILEIRTDEFKPCNPKRIEKGWVWKHVYVVHVKIDGSINWVELN